VVIIRFHSNYKWHSFRGAGPSGPVYRGKVTAYLDKNLPVLNKAADICWPIGKDDPDLSSGWSIMGVSTKEEYINMVGKSLDVTPEPNKQK
jgi:hypothetical protein